MLKQIKHALVMYLIERDCRKLVGHYQRRAGKLIAKSNRIIDRIASR
jgi:hypothetical protein